MLTTKMKVGKKTIDLEMPGLKALDDEQIAAVLTYVRREWGHEASPIDPPVIAALWRYWKLFYQKAGR